MANEIVFYQDQAVIYSPGNKTYTLYNNHSSAGTEKSIPSEQEVVIGTSRIHDCLVMIFHDISDNKYYLFHISKLFGSPNFDLSKLVQDEDPKRIANKSSNLAAHSDNFDYAVTLGKIKKDAQVELAIIVNKFLPDLDHYTETLQHALTNIKGTLINTNIIQTSATQYNHYYDVIFNPNGSLTIKTANKLYTETYSAPFQHNISDENQVDSTYTDEQISALSTKLRDLCDNDFPTKFLSGCTQLQSIISYALAFDSETINRDDLEKYKAIIDAISAILTQSSSSVCRFDPECYQKAIETLGILSLIIQNYSNASTYLAQAADTYIAKRRAETGYQRFMYAALAGAAFEKLENYSKALFYYQETGITYRVSSMNRIGISIASARVAQHLSNISENDKLKIKKDLECTRDDLERYLTNIDTLEPKVPDILNRELDICVSYLKLYSADTQRLVMS